MAIVKRFDRLDVTTSDLAGAVSTYQRNFGFQLKAAPEGNGATLKVGDAEIRLIGVDTTAQATVAGEGLAAVWLEAYDVEQVAQALRLAGIEPQPVVAEPGRRALAIDPKAAGGVPLFIFDRKG